MARRRDITREDILDATQRLLQTRGANGYGVRDLSSDIGFSPASLHHHFPSRAELLTAVLRRYRERLNARFAEIEAETDGLFRRLERIAGHFAALPGGEHRLCCAAVSAADLPTLPPPAREEAAALWGNFTGWLTRLTLQAKTEGELPAHANAETLALTFAATLQGALLLHRTAPPDVLRRILHEAVDALRRL